MQKTLEQLKRERAEKYEQQQRLTYELIQLDIEIQRQLKWVYRMAREGLL